MNGEQLRRLKRSAWMVLDTHEGRLVEQRKQQLGGIWPHATQFALAYICFAEISTLERQYQTIRGCLCNHLAGAIDLVDEPDLNCLTWECCLMSLRGDMDHYSLLQPSREFKTYVASYYDQQKALRQSTSAFPFIAGLTAFCTDEEPTLRSQEERWQAELEEDIRNLELSFNVENFEARMQEAERLCLAQADPALLLTLFP